MEDFKDKSGSFVKVGDLIVYGVMFSDSPGLCYGKVLEIVPQPPRYNALRKPKCKIRVIGVETYLSEIKLKRAGYLEYSDRVLVIGRNQVPSNILKKLDSINLEED